MKVNEEACASHSTKKSKSEMQSEYSDCDVHPVAQFLQHVERRTLTDLNESD